MFIREILFIKQAPSKQPLFIFYCGKLLSKSVSAKTVTLGYQGFFFFFSLTFFHQVAHNKNEIRRIERSYRQLRIRLNPLYISTYFVEFERLCHSSSAMFSRAARACVDVESAVKRELRHASWPHVCSLYDFYLVILWQEKRNRACITKLFSVSYYLFITCFNLRHNYLRRFLSPRNSQA